MSDYEYGPPDTYEVIWRSGAVEQVQAHQVTLPSPSLLGHFAGGPVPIRDTHVMIHGHLDGRWKLVLTAPAEDILSVRLVTADNLAQGGAS